MEKEQKERIKQFLKELTELSNKYELEITSEGNPPLLYDHKEGNYATEFGWSLFGDRYVPYYKD
ncbi:hypothetical protein [Bacillus smithii]|uniref:hypothetical protein n=1 Tax=Bacillus smithii TaxID=1479 RepID=UPI002E1C371C|nr:hypothetical protein [Bacillus smithii]MED4928252.1 hypothetical protein [Bacillus smithii]